MALPIFPGRRQPSIVSRNELNCRVRNGNGWTLALISTNSMSSGLAGEQTVLYCISLPLSRTFALEKSGDPYRIRTDVNGVRGRCLNHLTNGPLFLFWGTFPAPSKPNNVTPRSSTPASSRRSSPRAISTGQLHTLLHFHLRPIYQVVFLGPYPLSR